mmetsp:Transcript_18720/g.26097  ORF Transcript_18720/g.26097 Transcript_18720/m.26097 type:complete len:98 (-) Transcript_18720:155-448(-)
MPLPNQGGGTYVNSKITEKEERALLYNIACCYARLGQKEQAVGALQMCIDAGFREADTIRRDPDLESLHQSPEFENLVKSIQKSNPFDWVMSGFNPR